MCAMSRLSIGDIDELARLQRKILSLSASIDRLLMREKIQGTSDEGRDALAELLDDITAAARSMAVILNRSGSVRGLLE
jgi:hypothetical protein